MLNAEEFASRLENRLDQVWQDRGWRALTPEERARRHEFLVALYEELFSYLTEKVELKGATDIADGHSHSLSALGGIK